MTANYDNLKKKSPIIHTLSEWFPAILLFLGTIVLWQMLVTVLKVPRYILPSPLNILEIIIKRGADLVIQVGWTMLEAIMGFALGAGVAFIAASIFVHVRLIERSMLPWAIVLETVPIVAIAPLLTIWLGFGLAPKVVIAAIVCFFPVLVNTTRGLRSVAPQALELMHLLSASRWQVYFRVRLPSATPFIFSALKVASSLSVIGAIVAEFTGADRGIGYVVVSASYRLDTALLFAGITFSSLAGVVFYQIISGLERLILYWPGARLPE